MVNEDFNTQRKSESLNQELSEALDEGKLARASRRTLTALSGIPVPFVGGVLSAAADEWSETRQDYVNEMFAKWLRLHEDEIKEMEKTLFEVVIRLDPTDEKVRERVESHQYHSILKKCFREWSAAESEEKRVLLRNLLANAAAAQMATDDVVRLFVEWIAKYSELHFKVLAMVQQNPGITRWDIWQDLHGEDVREDSAEADLFRLIVHDLSLGRVIRQARKTDSYGRFLRKTARQRRGPFMESAFDDKKPYVLTGLGRQFVHYTMNEVVPKIEGTEHSAKSDDPENSMKTSKENQT